MATKQDEAAASQNINWQTRYLRVMEELQEKTKECEELKNKMVALKMINKQLAEHNSQLYREKNRNSPTEDLSKPNKVSVEDIHDRTKDEDSNSQTYALSQFTRQSLEQLTIDDEYWKNECSKKEQELKELNAKCDKLTKYSIDMSLKYEMLKEKKNEDLGQDNEDGGVVKCAKSAKQAENVDDSYYSDNKTQIVMFPSVFQSDSKPNFDFVNPFNCPASCVLSVIFFVFKEMKLNICSRKFPVQMNVDLNEISDPDVKLEVGPCNLMLEDLYHFGLIENVVRKENLNGIVEIDHALQEAIEKMAKPSYPALLVVRYTTKKTGHCMAIMHKTDQLNPTLRMKIYDVQKDKYWPKCDKHAKSIKQIEVYSVVEAEAKRLKDTSGVNICKAECLVCIPQLEVGPMNAVGL